MSIFAIGYNEISYTDEKDNCIFSSVIYGMFRLASSRENGFEGNCKG
ncbi:hypothetical protein HMPREF1475_00505 [Hoylesella oralis HGA0225]|nr:hypothetical protein HMPREF1475_00505 [Hoylesella oralis HGA0225]SHF64431.1 hypothetical protein SAMN05444288_1189 [Hoylesella oralis]